MGFFSSQRVPVIMQSQAPECGIACLAMVASYHGLLTDLAAMRVRLSPSMKGITLANVAELAETMGLTARGVKLALEDLDQLQRPALLHWDLNHFVVLVKADGKRITVHDPARGVRTLTLEEASQHFTGIAMEFTPGAKFVTKDEREKINLWQLLRLAGSHRSAILQLLLLSFALEVLTIASPYFLQITVDRVLLGRDISLLNVLGIGFGLLVLVQAAVIGFRAWTSTVLSTQINLSLMTTLFNHLLRLPLAWFEKRHIGDIVSRFRSIDAIQRTLTLNVVESLIDGVMVMLTLGVMVLYSPALAGIVVLAAVIYALLRWIFHFPQRYAIDEQLSHEGRSGTHFIETLRGMLAIKLNQREPERRSAYQNLVVDQINAGVKVQRITIAQRVAYTIVFGLEGVAIVWAGAHAVMDGTLSVGMLYAFLSFQTIFLSRVSALIDKLNEVRMLDLHADRISDIALAEPEPAPPPLHALQDTGPLTVETEGLGYAYGPEGQVFKDVNARFACGEIVAIAGPSGCGKSTLIKVLLGLFTPNRGRILVNGKELTPDNIGLYRRQIAAVLQDDQLFAGTVEDNISFFDVNHDMARVRECAQIACIADDIESWPMGYNTIVGSLSATLSSGQKQRVLLARALYRMPKLVFLDEAFDQLDLDNEGKVRTKLLERGVGIILVTHRPESLAAAQHVIYLAQPSSAQKAS